MGASHITLGCNDLSAAILSMQRYGYRSEFDARGIFNHPSKQSVLAARCEIHDIALLRSDGGFAIELVSYRNKMPNSVGPYIGVFETTAAVENIEPSTDDADLCRTLASGASMWTGNLDGLEAPAFFARNAKGDRGLTEIVLPVGDLNRAKQLWCGVLGFKLDREDSESASLQFFSPIAAWRIRMHLVASRASARPSLLDAKGMACLSFLSSNVSEDIPRLVASGATCATDIFAISINGKNMQVAILEGPDGGFIELLRIVR